MYVQDKFETYSFEHKKLEMKFEKLMYQLVEEEGEFLKTGKFLNVSYIYIIIITVSGIKVEESRGCKFVKDF